MDEKKQRLWQAVLQIEGESQEVYSADYHVGVLLIRSFDCEPWQGDRYDGLAEYGSLLELRHPNKRTLQRMMKAVDKLLSADEFQDIERTWLSVDLVYEARWDCRAGRLAAA